MMPPERSPAVPSGGSGIGSAGALTIAFIVLKLLGVITWSWWWVLAPAWIPVAVCVLVVIGFLVTAIIATLTEK